MITGFSTAALEQLSGALGGGGGGGVVVLDFAELSQQVARLAKTAGRLLEVASNPTWADGDEFCRRAATALENDWFEDAARDAERSVDAYPYRAMPHLFLALATLHVGDSAVAFDSLERAVEYGRAAEPNAGATAAVIAAALAVGAGHRDQAIEILGKADNACNSRCPQLRLALANPPYDAAHNSQLLVDDAYAWVGITTPAGFFGNFEDHLRVALGDLVGELDTAITGAQAHYEVLKGLTTDRIRIFPYDYGSLWEWRNVTDLRLLRAITNDVQEIVQIAEPAILIAAGTELLRLLAWRIPTVCAFDEGEWTSIRFVEEKVRGEAATATYPCELGELAVVDLNTQRWEEIRLDVKHGDQPHRRGQTTGTGTYLRALKGSDLFKAIADDLRRTAARVSAPRPSGWRVKQTDIAAWQADRDLAALSRQLLDSPPPLVDGLSRAIRRWLELTRQSGSPVVRPFAGVGLSMQIRDRLREPGSLTS